MYTIYKPEKKMNTYISKIKENGKNIKLLLNNVKFISNKNNIISYYIDNINDLLKIDEIVLNRAIDKNNEWFHNNLTNDIISQYFNNSVYNNIIHIFISDAKTPIISFNNKQILSLNDIKINNDYLINIEIEAYGVYFYKESFEIRWILRRMNIYDMNTLIQEDDIIDYKNNIENEWEYDISEFINKLNEDHNILKSKMEYIEKLKNQIEREFERAKEMEEINKSWDICLKNILYTILKYNNGSLRNNSKVLK